MLIETGHTAWMLLALGCSVVLSVGLDCALCRGPCLQVVTTVVGTLCFPIDTVKRRLMVQHSLSAPATTSNFVNTSVAAPGSTVVGTVPPSLPAPAGQGRLPYKGGWDCARRIVKEEGLRGLFVGLSVNLVRGFSGAVLLVAYDELKRYL